MADIDYTAKSDREILILLVDHVNHMSTAVQVQNGRVRSLEVWRALLTGGLSVVVLVVPLATAAILKLMG